MSLDLADLLDASSHIDAWGNTGTYTDPDEKDTTITLIFDDVHLETEIGGVAYMNAATVAICKTADVSNADNRAKITYDGVLYSVQEVKPDGTGATGATTLVLTKD